MRGDKVLRDSRIPGEAMFAAFIPATWAAFDLYVDRTFIKTVGVEDLHQRLRIAIDQRITAMRCWP